MSSESTEQGRAKKTKPIRAHWIALMRGFIEISGAIGLAFYWELNVADTWSRVYSLWNSTYPGYSLNDLSVAIDLAIWLFLAGSLVSLAQGLIYLATTKVILLKAGIRWQTGFFHRHTTKMQYKDAESVDLYQSWIGVILGYGTVTMRGRGSGALIAKNITQPMALLNHIDRQIARNPERT